MQFIAFGALNIYLIGADIRWYDSEDKGVK